MAVPPAIPIASQRVITVLLRQRFMLDQQLNHGFKFVEIFAPLLLPFDVLLELAGLSDFHDSHDVNSAFVESC